MEEYLKKIKQVKLLSPDEEKGLWIKYKEYDEIEARQYLIKAYQPLVFKLVRQLADDKDIMMDLIQEGNIGLIDAVDSFDHQRKTKFVTFAVYHIKGRMVDFLNNGLSKNYIKQAEILPELPEVAAEKALLLDKVKKVMKDLSPRERQVVRELILNNREATLVASEMGISLSYLYRLQKKAVKRIRGKLSRFMHMWK